MPMTSFTVLPHFSTDDGRRAERRETIASGGEGASHAPQDGGSSAGPGSAGGGGGRGGVDPDHGPGAVGAELDRLAELASGPEPETAAGADLRLQAGGEGIGDRLAGIL